MASIATYGTWARIGCGVSALGLGAAGCYSVATTVAFLTAYYVAKNQILFPPFDTEEKLTEAHRLATDTPYKFFCFNVGNAIGWAATAGAVLHTSYLLGKVAVVGAGALVSNLSLIIALAGLMLAAASTFIPPALRC